MCCHPRHEKLDLVQTKSVLHSHDRNLLVQAFLSEARTIRKYQVRRVPNIDAEVIHTVDLYICLYRLVVSSNSQRNVFGVPLIPPSQGITNTSLVFPFARASSWTRTRSLLDLEEGASTLRFLCVGVSSVALMAPDR